jgi:hypothetical protein
MYQTKNCKSCVSSGISKAQGKKLSAILQSKTGVIDIGGIGPIEDESNSVFRVKSVTKTESEAKFLQSQLESQYRVDNEIFTYPQSGRLRTQNLMRDKEEHPHLWFYRVGVVAFCTLSVVGALFAAIGAGWLVEEARQIKLYGVNADSGALKYHHGWRGWTFIAIGYAMSTLRRGGTIAAYIMDRNDPRLFLRRVYPELAQSHIVRDVGYFLADGIFTFTAMAVALEYKFSNTAKSATGCTPYQETYLYRLGGAIPVFLIISAIIQVITVIVMAYPQFDGLNVCYILPLCRCGEELGPVSTPQQLEADDSAFDNLKGTDLSVSISSLPPLHSISMQRMEPNVGVDKQSKITPASRDQTQSPTQTTQTDDDEYETPDKFTITGFVKHYGPRVAILMLYNDPCGCFVRRHNQTVQEKVRNCGFATLSHNWYGALRMHIYVATLFFSLGVWAQVQSVWLHAQTPRNYIWPVYMRAEGFHNFEVDSLSWARRQQIEIANGRLFPESTPHSEHPHHTPTHIDLVSGHQGILPSPPSPPPPSPSSPPMIPLSPLVPDTIWGLSFPRPFLQGSTRSGCVATYVNGNKKVKSNTLELPPNLHEDDDSSAWMEVAASFWLAAEIFRVLSAFGYWMGVVRNEASVPRSHAATNGKLIRAFCP